MIPRSVLSLVLIGCSTTIADGALLEMEFAGGGSEVTLAPGAAVQIDVAWTMHATDTAEISLNSVNLRFNVNDGPNPDGSDRNHKYVVEAANATLAEWSSDPTLGVGDYFSESGFFLSVYDARLGNPGFPGDGTEFVTQIASFVLRKTDLQPGDTYISFRHLDDADPLPDATYGAGNVWDLRWQSDITDLGQFDMGLGNPGDAGPQWDPRHGFETFQPLIIHNVPEPAALGLLMIAAFVPLLRRPRRTRL